MTKKQKELQYLPFVEIFDSALAKEQTRILEPRDYIYASEISTSMYDRYLSMKGVPYSNAPNEIAIRKFKIGALIEDFFKIVLFEVGLLKKQEERVYSNFDFGLKVSGRLDVTYGGSFNINDINDILEKFNFLSFIGLLSDAIKEFAKLNPNNNYSDCGLEIKSCSEYIFNAIEQTNEPLHHHKLQAFHYAKWTGLPFQIVYFDKNNARMKSFWIYGDDAELLKIYKEDITKMTYYYENNIIPPKEDLIVFNKRFSKNWQVEYSKYLTSHYGFQTKQEYRDLITSKSGRWNRVLVKIEKNEKITDDNKKAIQEMRDAGYNIEILKTNEVVDVEAEIVVESKTSISKMEKLNTLNKFLS